MQRKTDLLIVGGGIVGLFIAYYASGNGRKVTVVEKERVGSGASSRNRGGIREQFSNEETIRIMHYSMGLWESLPKDLGWNILFDQKGYLIVARSEEQMNQLKANVKLQNKVGLQSRLVTPEEVLDRVPFISPKNLVGGSFNHSDGIVHHDAALWAVEKADRRRGVEILEGVECKNFVASSGKVVGADTSAGMFQCGSVVNATGVHSKDLAATVGIDLPVKSFRRETMVTEAYKLVVRPVLWDLTINAVLSQTLRGEIHCSTRDPFTEESRDLDATYLYLTRLASVIAELSPTLSNIRVLRHWAGHYDVTPDGSPILGELDDLEGLYLASGFSGHGFMMAPAVGRLFAELLGGGSPPPLLVPFSYRRFAEGRLLKETLVSGRKIAA